MRLVGCEEKAEGHVGVDAAFHEVLHGLKVGIIPFAEILEWEYRLGSNVGFAAHGDTVTERLQVVDDALGARIGESVVWVGPSLERRLTGVEVVARGRAGRSSLKTIIEEHALCGEPVHMRGVGLSAIAAYVEVTEIVGQNENEVGFGNRGKGRDYENRENDSNSIGVHGKLMATIGRRV